MITYNSFSIFEQVSKDGLFKERYLTPQTLFRKHNLYTASYGWLDSTDEPAAGTDMYCYDHDNMGMLRDWYNANHPAMDLDYYDDERFFEDVIYRGFKRSNLNVN